MPTRAASPCPRCRRLTWRRQANGHGTCTHCGHISNTHTQSAARRGYDATWRDVVAQVLKRDGYRCQIRLQGCTRYATTGDHIIPRSRGGSNHPSNVQAACHHCNSTKQARLL